MSLSNGEETVFLAAIIPELLGVNHCRDGGPDGRTDIDDSNRGNQPLVAFPLIKCLLHLLETLKHNSKKIFPNFMLTPNVFVISYIYYETVLFLGETQPKVGSPYCYRRCPSVRPALRHGDD